MVCFINDSGQEDALFCDDYRCLYKYLDKFILPEFVNKMVIPQAEKARVKYVFAEAFSGL
ncbi:hypothetical protein [Bartonella machadoae]|uniref:hypothetical protein n=1 Tax=Bartonella machadoae TaxID=2893471 RepID=UPI001F4D32FE|nr:hypothetical protein [Bartonella machadoae]UNE53577.1 hypothetical protein LNM86_07895 [Bartonella machadoae]